MSDEPIKETDRDEDKDPEVRKNIKCKIFFSYTSNLISSGLREWRLH
jgi:deoxyhypusine synthase